MGDPAWRNSAMVGWFGSLAGWDKIGWDEL